MGITCETRRTYLLIVGGLLWTTLVNAWQIRLLTAGFSEISTVDKVV